VQFQKILGHTPPQKGLGFPGVGGFSKTKTFKGMYQAQLKFPESWGVLEKSVPWGRLWIVSGTTHCVNYASVIVFIYLFNIYLFIYLFIYILIYRTMRHGALKLCFAVSLFGTRFESKASKPKQTKKRNKKLSNL